MSAADAELWAARRELADKLDAYPVGTWTPQLTRAVVNLLDAYGVVREAELNLTDTRPMPVIRLVEH